MVIQGLNEIEEALLSGAEVEKIILPASRRDRRIERIKELARKKGVVFLFSPAEKKGRAYVSQVALAEEEEVLSSGRVLALDRVEDPMNLGAIIRTAFAFGFPVVLEKRHSPPLNETVARASAGALFRATIHRTSSLQAFLRRAREGGYWVIGAERGGEGLDLFSPPEKFVVVMGSEGKGLRKPISSLCDFKVEIPMREDFNSLNVSVAAGIILYSLSKK